MQLKWGFNWIGLVIFLLPMVINVFYVLFPPKNAPEDAPKGNKMLEAVEKISRMLYLAAMAALVSGRPAALRSPWWVLAAAFLALYHAVWIRYFAGGRDVALLGKSFCGVPMPLAVFPVLYYLCGALWLHNLPAAGLMLIFGVAHNVVSYRSFQK